MKSATIKILSALIIGLISIGGQNAQASTLFWTSWKRIDRLEPAVGSWVWVYLENDEQVSCGTVSNVNPFFGHSEAQPGYDFPTAANGGYERVYSTLLTALVSNREIRLRLKPSSDNVFCSIERIQIR